MSQAYEDRVVEMRFDNENFEAGAKQSISTIEHLKKALDFSSAEKSFSKIDKAAGQVDLSTLEKGVQSIEDRFSSLGIAGMRVIQNLTDDIYGFAKKGIGFLFDSINQGGLRRATNVENARFQLQSLLRDEEKVTGIMQVAKDSVDGTAYAFDVAAKASSMFAASGITDLDLMGQALGAIANSTAAVNGNYESMVDIFTQVAGQGRLMGIQLQRLSFQGMNAAALIAKYFQEVHGIVEITEADVRQMVSNGEISFQTLVESMNHAYEGAAKRANETFNGAFANVKSALARIGEGFYAPLIAQNSEVVNLLNALRVRINDVKSELVYDEQLGNVTALTKRASDAVLSLAKNMAKVISNADVKTGVQIFEKGVEVVINSIKLLGRVLEPVAKAFSDFGGSIGATDVYKFVAALALLIEETKLSTGAFQNLFNMAKGVKDILNAVGHVLGYLLGGIIYNLSGPFSAFGSLLLNIVGIIGQLLSALARFLQTSYAVHFILDAIILLLSAPITLISNIISYIKLLKERMDSLGLTDRLVRAFDLIMKRLDYLAAVLLPKIDTDVEYIGEGVMQLIDAGVMTGIERFVTLIEKLSVAIMRIDFTNIKSPLEALKDGMAKIKAILSGGKDSLFSAFRADTEDAAVAAISLENVQQKLKTFGDGYSSLMEKLKANVSLGQTIALIGSGLMLAGITRITEALSKMSNAFNTWKLVPSSIIKTLNTVNRTLYAYQKELRAERLLTIAKAIAVLAASFLLLSFGDTDKVVKSALVLTLLAAVLIGGLTALELALHQGSRVNAEIKTVSGGIAAALQNLSSGFMQAKKAMAIGKIFVRISETLLVAVGSLIALSLFYEKHADSMTTAFYTMALMFLSVGGALAAMTIVSAMLPKATKQVSEITKTISVLSIGLGLMLITLSSVLSMELPENWLVRVGVIAGLILELTGVMIALSVFSKWGGGKSIDNAIKPVIAIAGSLSLVVMAIRKLVKTPFDEDSNKKIWLIVGLIAELGAISAVLTRLAGGFFGKAEIIGLTGPIIAMSGSLYLIVIALKKMLSLTLDDTFKEKFKVLNQLLLELAGVMAVLTFIGGFGKGGGVASSAGTVLAMSIFLVTAVASLMVVTLLPLDKLLNSAITIGVIFLALGAALAGAGRIQNFGAGKAVIAMIGVIAALTISMTLLSFLDWEALYTAVGALSTVLLVIGAMMHGMGAIDEAPIRALAVTILSLAGITGAIYVLASSEADWKKIAAIGAAISMALASISVCLRLLAKTDLFKGVEWNQIGKTVTLAFGVLGVVSLAIGALSAVSFKGDMLKTATALSITLVAITVPLRLLADSDLFQNADWENVKTTTLMALGLLIPVSLAIGALAAFGSNFDQMPRIAASLSIGLLGIMFPLRMLVEQDWVGSAGGVLTQALATLAQAIALLAPVGLAIGLLSNLGSNFDQMPIIAIALSLGMIGFSAAFVLISKCASNVNLGAIGSLLLASIALVPVAGALYLLATTGDWKAIIAAAASITLALTGISVALALCAAIGGLAGVAIPGILVFDLFVINMIILMELIGALMTLDGFRSLLEDGGEALRLVGEALGGFAGGIVSGLAGGVADSMAKIGQGLSDFWINSEAFFTGVQGIKPGIMDSVKAMAGAMLLITEAEFIQGIANFISTLLGGGSTSPMAKFGSQIAELGPYIKEFSDSVAGINAEKVTAAANAIGIMTELAKGLPKEGGWLQAIFGENKSLSDFGEELSKFAPKFVEYAEAVSGITEDDVSASANAVQILIDLANNLPETGGMIQAVFGEKKSLSDFGRELGSFGLTFPTYVERVRGITEDDVSASANAAQMLVDLANKLPETKGLYGILFGGEKSLAQFGRELIPFGAAMVLYAGTIGGIRSDLVLKSAVAAQALAEVKNALPEDGRWMAKIFGGEQSLTKFGKELAAFGKNLVAYGETIDGINVEKFGSVSEQLMDLIEVCRSVVGANVGNLTTFILSVKDAAADGVTGFIDEFQNRKPEMAAVIQQFLSYAIQQLGLRDIAFQEAGQSNAMAVLKGVSGITESEIDPSIDHFINLIIERIQFYDTLFTSLGSITVDKFTFGIRSLYGTSLKDTGVGMATSVVSGINQTLWGSTPGQMYQLGVYAAQGFSQGMLSKEKEVYNSAVLAMGDATEEAIRERLKINSPSWLTWLLGGFTGEGFFGGLMEWKDKIIGAAGDWGGGFLEKLGGILNGEEEGAGLLENVTGGVENISEEIEEQVETMLGSLDTLADTVSTTNASVTQSNEETLTQQDIFWNAILGIQKKGENASKYAAMTYKEYEQEVLSKTTSLVDDYNKSLESTADAIFKEKNMLEGLEPRLKAVTKDIYNQVDAFSAVSDASKEAAKSINDQIGAFDSVKKNSSVSLNPFSDMSSSDEEDVVTKDTLQERINTQLSKYEEFANVMNSLKQRIGSENFLSYIASLGIDSLDNLRALNNMTQYELETYVDAYEREYAIAQSLSEDAAKVTVQTLQKNLEDQVAQYKEFRDMIVSLNERVTDQDIRDMINNMSMSDIDNLRLLNSMTETELNRWIETYREKFAVSTEIAAAQGKEFGSVSKQSLQKNLEDQVALYERFRETMKEFRARVTDERLLNIVDGFTVSNMAELQAFNSMTEEELNRYIETLRQKEEEAAQIAKDQMERSAITPEQLLRNQEQVLQARENFEKTLRALNKRIMDSDFKAWINEMGIDDLETLDAILSMSDEQITAYIQGWHDLQDQAMQEARIKNRDLKNVTQQELAQLYGLDEVGLERFKKTWDGTMDSIYAYISKQVKTDVNDSSMAALAMALFDGLAEAINTGGDEVTDAKTEVVSNTPETVETATAAGTELGNETVGGVTSKSEDMKAAGQKLADQYIAGIKNRKKKAKSAGSLIAQSSVDGLNSQYNGFHYAGEGAGMGFVNGLLSMELAATEAGRRIAAAAYAAAMAALDENSPSKKMYQVGAYAGIGLANGINSCVGMVEDASGDLGYTTLDTLQTYVNTMTSLLEAGFEIVPVITPIVDTSNAYQAADDVYSMFNHAIAMNYGNTMGTYNSFQQMPGRRGSSISTGGMEREDGVTSINFTQNNYSPKALSAIEIYRQTKNQLSAARGALT